jgi:replicative DNA helicase
VTTGLETLNAKIGGLHRSDLVIVAGRPAWASRRSPPTWPSPPPSAFFATRRTGSSPKSRPAPRSPVQPRNVGRPARHPHPCRAVGDQLREFADGQDQQAGVPPARPRRRRARGLPLYIDDTPGLTIAALRARARRLKRQKGIGLVIVDYLQLLQGTGRNSNENRVNEISEISRGLKQLAKELNVPVIGLSQLSRAVEQREDKRPQLSDLRESGSIEQDADIVLFIFREDYYLAAKQPADDHPDAEEWRQDMERAYGRAEVIVAKQRHGATGKVRLKFDSRITKFSDPADEAFLPEARG